MEKYLTKNLDLIFIGSNILEKKNLEENKKKDEENENLENILDLGILD